MKTVSMSLLTTTTTATGHRYETCTTENTAKITLLPLINILGSGI